MIVKAVMVLAMLIAMQLILIIAGGVMLDQGPDKTTIHVGPLES